MTPDLIDALETFNATSLGHVLLWAGVAEIPKLKDDKILLWLDLVGDPQRIQRALQRLSEQERRALQILQIKGGELRTERFRSLVQQAGLVAPEETKPRGYGALAGLAPKKPSDKPDFSTLLENLLRWGLIWTHTLGERQPANAKLNFDGGRFVYIPDEVAPHLPSPPESRQALPQVAASLEGSARTVQRDLYLVWSAAREAPLVLLASGLLRLSDLKRVSGQLLVSETIGKGAKESDIRRVLFLRQLLRALDLLAIDYNTLSARPDPPFFKQQAIERVRLTYESWRAALWWNELWRTYTQGQTSASGSLAERAPQQVAQARQAVVDHLARQARPSPQDWIAVDDLVDGLRDRNDEFLLGSEPVKEGVRGYSYTYRSYGSRYHDNVLGWVWYQHSTNSEAAWNSVERVFIEAVLTEGLYWLGLLDLGYASAVTPQGGAAPGRPLAVRLTDMGRWLLLNEPPPAIPQETGRVVVQPNFHIFAFDPISDAVLARLDTFAVRQNAERAIEYVVSRESVYRAQLAGQAAGEIQAWLEQVTGAALPQNVARSLAEWQGDFERIVIRGRVGWLETTAELADTLMDDPALQPAILRRISPTGILVHADRMDELEQALLAAGELPARSADPANAHRNSITLAEDGRIAFVHQTHSIYAYGRLQDVGEQTDEGWRVTRASVSRARQAGLDPAAIIAALEAMAVGGAPAALQQQIKAWASYYGAASVQTVTLVQFKSQETLEELLADPALARLLKPWPPQTKLGMARVALQDVATVRKLLAERGMEVKEG
ncbi:MAG TPA: helicase-associated domain-containing protein [Anaerolineae bacterium]|nr:helicase-associated domain-containing protein [Anaerolineae bacterium]